MELSGNQGGRRRRASLGALIIAALAVWRMPRVMGLAQESALFASHAFRLALAGGLFLLLRRALGCRDRRLARNAFLLGALFAALTLAGEQLKANGAFLPLTPAGMLDCLFTWFLFAMAFGSGLILAAQGMLRVTLGERKKETLLGRVTSSFWAVFLLLMLCWTPVWLAFWPGTFMYDASTQFYTYMDGMFSTHHPLLHTLLLGLCMTKGIELHPEGYATYGVAIYSLVQMLLLSAMLAHACRWLAKRGAPLWARLLVTLLFALFPFYALWSFSATKDILFGGLVLVFVLELMDLWRDGYAALRSPLRIIRLVAASVLMMLMRNNGVYAFCLLIPLACLWAKGARARMAALLCGCVAAYFLANGALIWATEAESGSRVEMLSIPLQQMARTLRDHPDALPEDGQELLAALYPDGFEVHYEPAIADPVKWAVDYDALDENLPQLLKLWARMGLRQPVSYVEAFWEQNLPYLLPGAEMLYRFTLGIDQLDLYPIEENSLLPALRKPYETYDQTLSFLGLPGVRLLSDTAFYVWLCMAGLAYAQYRRQRAWMAAFGFLLALWVTCLLGPVALMRYMLGLFYAVPVLFAAMLAPWAEEGACPAPQAQSGRNNARKR